MARKTKKYVAACKLLSIPVDADVPHEALYGMLALRGHNWSGDAWVMDKEGDNLCTASLRLSADPQHAQDLTHTISQILAEIGIDTSNIRGPYENRKDKKQRWYITIQYRVR